MCDYIFFHDLSLYLLIYMYSTRDFDVVERLDLHRIPCVDHPNSFHTPFSGFMHSLISILAFLESKKVRRVTLRWWTFVTICRREASKQAKAIVSFLSQMLYCYIIALFIPFQISHCIDYTSYFLSCNAAKQ